MSNRGSGFDAMREWEALMSRSNVMTVGFAVGSVLIAIGTLLQWIDDSKLNLPALGEIAFASMLLCILVRKKCARRRGAQ